MEIGEQRTNETEFEAGRDEEFGFAGMRLNRTIRKSARDRLEGADRGCSHGDDAAGTARGGVECGGGFGRERIALAMKPYFFYALDAQRSKGAEADMERDVRNLHAAICNLSERLRRKMQPGGGRGHRSALAGKDRLIAFAIGGLVGAMDIGRQRNVPDAVANGEDIPDRRKLNEALAVATAIEHLGFENNLAVRSRKNQPLPDGDLAARPHERAPFIFARGLGQHNFDAAGWLILFSAQGAAREEPCRNDAAVIEHQQIARLQQRGKLRKRAVAKCACDAIHDQHAALASLGRRLLRYQLLGQVEIEVRNTQARGRFAHCSALPRYASAFRRARSSVSSSSCLLRSKSCCVISAGMRIGRAQLTTIRVNGFGTRKRSQERMTHARAGSR